MLAEQNKKTEDEVTPDAIFLILLTNTFALLSGKIVCSFDGTENVSLHPLSLPCPVVSGYHWAKTQNHLLSPSQQQAEVPLLLFQSKLIRCRLQIQQILPLYSKWCSKKPVFAAGACGCVRCLPVTSLGSILPKYCWARRRLSGWELQWEQRRVLIWTLCADVGGDYSLWRDAQTDLWPTLTGWSSDPLALISNQYAAQSGSTIQVWCWFPHDYQGKRLQSTSGRLANS